jgi:putative membrane-bound dehydrogenase-like protein
MLRSPLLTTIVLTGLSAGIGSTTAAENSPLSPKAALKRFVLHPKLRIELVACEPQVVDPVAIAFDEDGRLWVVEMRDYPNGPPKGKPPMSRIRLLEDRDGDGFYETARTFADKLPFATGIQPWKGGVIVTLAGEVAYFKDTNGDGRADVRETWFTGFAEKNPQLRANHPTFALDNHVYVANGLRGGTVIARRKEWAKNAKPVSISGMDFRFDPLTGKYEAVSGPGQFGLTFDDFGNRFVCSNRNPCRHVVLEDRYLKRNPYLAVPSVLYDVSPAGAESRVYPISRAWTTSNLHAGQFTAACGVTIYRGDLLPREFRGNSFTCEPTGNLVHRDVLKPQGATFTSRPGRKGIEFLATKDEWFRPVNLANGPDGALYVVDMYRAVIEHPQWVPAELKHRPDERFGDDRGRIYRIVPLMSPFAPRKGAGRRDRGRNGKSRPFAERKATLSGRTTADLVKLLEHRNAWRRMTAARLLYERQDKSAAKPLTRILADVEQSQAARVHALWALHGLGRLTKDHIHLAIQLVRLRARQRLREHGYRLSEPWLLAKDRVISYSVGKSDASDDPRTRFQAALSLGTELDNPTQLALIGIRGADDPWTRRAVVSSSVGLQGHVLQALVSLPAQVPEALKNPGMRDLFEELCENIGGEGGKSRAAIALRALNSLDTDATRRNWRLAGMIGLARGLNRRGKRLATYVAALSEKERKPIEAMYADVVRATTSKAVPRQRRLQVIPFLRHVGERLAEPALKQLVLDETDQSVRLVAISVLAAYPPGDVDRRLLKRFNFESPETKRAILDLSLSGMKRTNTLLDEIAAKRISVNELDPLRVRRLTRHRNRGIRSRALKLLAAAIPADRKKVLAEYQPALAMKADPKRGLEVFRKNCTACHRIGTLGVNVAPDISDSRTKTPAQLLVSILDPNRAIDSNYISYTAVTADGKVHTGIIAVETASSITLRQQENKTVTLLRKDVETLKSNGISLMPVGLEKNVTVQQMADLIAYIKNWRYLDGRVPVRSPGK